MCSGGALLSHDVLGGEKHSFTSSEIVRKQSSGLPKGLSPTGLDKGLILLTDFSTTGHAQNIQEKVINPYFQTEP